MSEPEAIYFWGPNEGNGFLSNGFESPFVKYGKHFTNNEQYFMWEKAAMF